MQNVALYFFPSAEALAPESDLYFLYFPGISEGSERIFLG